MAFINRLRSTHCREFHDLQLYRLAYFVRSTQFDNCAGGYTAQTPAGAPTGGCAGQGGARLYDRPPGQAPGLERKTLTPKTNQKNHKKWLSWSFLLVLRCFIVNYLVD